METKYDCFGAKSGKCCAPSIRRNNYLVLLAMIGFITGMFIFFLWLKKAVTRQQINYPPTYDCDAYLSSFGKDKIGAE
jgi:hypothetical protein